jgi:hypothetical protein
VTPSDPAIADLVERVREDYLNQFRAMVAQKRQSGSDGSPELKLQLNEASDLYRNVYCIDFVENPAKPRLFDLKSDHSLGFAPVTGTLGGMTLRITGLKWDDVTITHDRPDLRPECLADWFETWFDPEDKRHDPAAELSSNIHSLMVSEQSVSADFGSAPVAAFWSLLDVLEKAGVKNVRISNEED